MKTPIMIAFGWSADATSPLSCAIRYLTRPKMAPWSRWGLWSHMFLVFQFEDNSQVIHEALMSEGWQVKDARKLTAWKKKDPKHHTYTVKWLTIDPGKVALIYQASCAWIGTKSYAVRQLAAFGLAESMLGRWLGLSLQSGADEVICSEGACRLVGEIAPEWDLRKTPDQSWDSVSPQAAYEEWKKMSVGAALAYQLGDDITLPGV